MSWGAKLQRMFSSVRKHPQVQPIRVDVLDLPQRPRIHQSLEADDARVVPQEVPDHQDALLLLRERDDRAPVLRRQGQGLLDVDVLPRRDGLAGARGVRDRRRGEDHRLDEGVGQDLVERLGRADARVLLLEGCQPGGIGIAHRPERPQRREVPDEVLPPVATADHGNVRFSHDGLLVRIAHGAWGIAHRA